ncbi:MAG: SlyX family protein [Alphaproteobacteria bacterium]|nr:SlyX family protein [Alphaproteobacteria bacterium]
MDDRITDLEVKLAFQEHTIAELDEVVRMLAQKVEVLERRIEEAIAEQAASQAPLDNPPPPHW